MPSAQTIYGGARRAHASSDARHESQMEKKANKVLCCMYWFFDGLAVVITNCGDNKTQKREGSCRA